MNRKLASILRFMLVPVSVYSGMAAAYSVFVWFHPLTTRDSVLTGVLLTMGGTAAIVAIFATVSWFRFEASNPKKTRQFVTSAFISFFLIVIVDVIVAYYI